MRAQAHAESCVIRGQNLGKNGGLRKYDRVFMMLDSVFNIWDIFYPRWKNNPRIGITLG